MPPPDPADVLPTIVLFTSSVGDWFQQATPPPQSSAQLDAMTLWMRMGCAPSFANIPPPTLAKNLVSRVRFPVIRFPTMTGLLPLRHEIPPPRNAPFPEMTLFTRLHAIAERKFTPPPAPHWPPRIVSPEIVTLLTPSRRMTPPVPRASRTERPGPLPRSDTSGV